MALSNISEIVLAVEYAVLRTMDAYATVQDIPLAKWAHRAFMDMDKYLLDLLPPDPPEDLEVE